MHCLPPESMHDGIICIHDNKIIELEIHMYIQWKSGCCILEPHLVHKWL